jgi:hypothetical protein
MNRKNPIMETEANAISLNACVRFNVELALVKNNACVGIAAVEAKGPSAAAPRLRELVKELMVASEALAHAKPYLGSTRELMAEVYADRKILIALLVAWGQVGLVPAHEVSRIASSQGPLDAASNVIDIINMPSVYPATVGKLLLQSTELAPMLARAKALRALVTPTGCRARPNNALDEAIAYQSRVWTLLKRQHELLWKEGAQLYGKAVDEYVIPLGSRKVHKRKTAPGPARPAYGAPHEPEPAPT